MINDVVKSEVYIQNRDGLYISYFHYMIKTHLIGTVICHSRC